MAALPRPPDKIGNMPINNGGNSAPLAKAVETADELESLRSTIRKLTTDNSKLEFAVVKITEENTKLTDLLNDAKKELSEVEHSFKESVDMLQMFKSRIAELTEEKDAIYESLSSRIEALESENSLLLSSALANDDKSPREESLWTNEDVMRALILRLRDTLRRTTDKLISDLIRVEDEVEVVTPLVEEIHREKRKHEISKGVIHVNNPANQSNRRKSVPLGQLSPSLHPLPFGSPSQRLPVYGSAVPEADDEETEAHSVDGNSQSETDDANEYANKDNVIPAVTKLGQSVPDDINVDLGTEYPQLDVWDENPMMRPTPKLAS